MHRATATGKLRPGGHMGPIKLLNPARRTGRNDVRTRFGAAVWDVFLAAVVLQWRLLKAEDSLLVHQEMKLWPFKASFPTAFGANQQNSSLLKHAGQSKSLLRLQMRPPNNTWGIMRRRPVEPAASPPKSNRFDVTLYFKRLSHP